MILFKRRGRPRFGNGFRPAVRRRGGVLKQSVAVPKTSRFSSMTVTEIKAFLDTNNVAYTSSALKPELTALAEAV